MELMYYLCGGAGINIGKALLKSPADAVSKMNREAGFVGLDSSNANDAEGLFEVEHMPSSKSSDGLAKGSGKVQSTNYDKSVPFIKECLGRHKPAEFNIVVFSDAGGTGSMLAVMLVRELLRQGKVVVLMIISDHTSLVERKNSTNTLKSLVAQTTPGQLNKPIAFMQCINDTEHTRAEINAMCLNNLNLVSIFLTEGNEEADYEDIFNLLNYNKVLGVPPALSRIAFHSKEDAVKFDGKPPIAYISLFHDREAIIPRFDGGGYRVTGVLNEACKTLGMEEIHLTLDHGESVDELAKQVAEMDTLQATKQMTYTETQNFGTGDDNGFCFD